MGAEREQLVRALVAYGGRVSEVADRAAVAAYARRLAAERAPNGAGRPTNGAGRVPRLAVEERLFAAADWAGQPVDVVTAATDREALTRVLLAAEVGVGLVDCGIADTGQLALYSGGEPGRILAYFSPVYVAVLPAERVLATLDELLVQLVQAGLHNTPAVTLIAGCSASADIENIVTAGVHGPVELHVLVVRHL